MKIQKGNKKGVDAAKHDAWPYNGWWAQNGPIITPHTLLDKAPQEHFPPKR